jgi:hypothetical protein
MMEQRKSGNGVKVAKRVANDKKILTIEYCKDRFGWCETGIRNFMLLNNIENIESITVKELRNIAIKNRKINCKYYRNYMKKLGIILNCK